MKTFQMMSLVTLMLAVGGASAEASAINFINNSSDPNIEFQVYQGTHQVARVGVAEGDTEALRTTIDYQVTASTTAPGTAQEIMLDSNPVLFSSDSAVLSAQVTMVNGCPHLELTSGPGLKADTITMEDQWTEPVEFKLTRPNSPFELVTVVDEHGNQNFVPPVQAYEVFALVNGVTVGEVSIMDPNARITATQNNNDSGITLVVSRRE